MLSTRLGFKKVFILNLLSKKKKEELKLGQTLHRMYLSNFTDKFLKSKPEKNSSNNDLLNLNFDITGTETSSKPSVKNPKQPNKPSNSSDVLNTPNSRHSFRIGNQDRVDGFVGEWNFDPEDDPQKFIKNKVGFFDSLKNKKKDKANNSSKGFFGLRFFQQKENQNEKIVDEILTKQRERLRGVEDDGRQMHRVVNCEGAEVYIRHIDFHSIGNLAIPYPTFKMTTD